MIDGNSNVLHRIRPWFHPFALLTGITGALLTAKLLWQGWAGESTVLAIVIGLTHGIGMTWYGLGRETQIVTTPGGLSINSIFGHRAVYWRDVQEIVVRERPHWQDDGLLWAFGIGGLRRNRELSNEFYWMGWRKGITLVCANRHIHIEALTVQQATELRAASLAK